MAIALAFERAGDVERRHESRQLTVIQQIRGIPGMPACRLPARERLVQQYSARFERVDDRRHQRTMEVVEHEHASAGANFVQL